MARTFLSLLCLGVLLPCEGFCPAGFDNMPSAWKIPDWPRDMSEEEGAKLHVITLGGFTKPEINDEYLEGPTPAFTIQGKKTYWSVSGDYFLYYCKKFSKWRVAGTPGFDDNKNGACLAFVSDAKTDSDVLIPILGWAEAVNRTWGVSDTSGITHVGKLAEQFEALRLEKEAAEAAAATDSGKCEAVMSEGDAGQKESKCPIMPAVRAVKAEVSKASKWATKWLRRLFPQLLPAPDDEAEEAVDEPEGAKFEPDSPEPEL